MTKGNMEKRYVGSRTDEALCPEGIQQLKQYPYPAVRYVYSSPLRRAVQTAGQIAPGAEILLDERLIEMDYGPYEGADLHNLPPEILTFFSDFVHNPAPAGMEQLGAVVARVGAFLEELRESEENILISTHAIAMKGILEYLTPASNGAYWSKFIGNCAVYISQNQNGQFTVPTELP